ncbi:MAG: flagellar basal body-associated FliL family protein [Rhodospirillales bacterium]|nr:flagellar basal body-associated FliL family protein [Rhodospirillales bacterium]
MAEDNISADVAADLDGGREAAGGRRRSRALMLAAGGATLLFVGGGVYGSGVLDGVLGVGSEETAGEEAAAGEAPATVTFYELPDLVVSLNTNERKSTFLKARVTLELADSAGVAVVEQVMPRIIDYCQVYLRELRPDDLRGSAGTLRLREELRRRVAMAIAPARLRDVLFVELLVQ